MYNSFFNAQDKKDAAHPYGITEDDDTSIRLHNLAYNFAEAIACGVNGEGGGNTGGILLDYLKKSGGNMSGMLTAGYGFEAGCENTKVLEVFRENSPEDGNGPILAGYGVKIHGDLKISGGSLSVNGQKIVDYDGTHKTAFITSPYIDFSESQLLTKGSILFGENKKSGVFISPVGIQVGGSNVYHEGNANKGSVDWLLLNEKAFPIKPQPLHGQIQLLMMYCT